MFIVGGGGGDAFSNLFKIFQQVTIVTSQPGRQLVRQLEMGLKDADLVSLKRLLVVQICHAGDWGQDSPSPEAQGAESEGWKWLQYCNVDICVALETEIYWFGQNSTKGVLMGKQ